MNVTTESSYYSYLIHMFVQQIYAGHQLSFDVMLGTSLHMRTSPSPPSPHYRPCTWLNIEYAPKAWAADAVGRKQGNLRRGEG